MASRLQDVILRGTSGARPAATAVANGTLYYSTDTAETDQSDGAVWNTYTDEGGISQLTGDVTAGPGSGSVAATIPNDTVTYAKMQNVSTTDRLLGRDGAAPGDVEEIAVSSGLEFTGSTSIRTKAIVRTTTIGITVDAGTDVVAAGQKGYRSFPVAATVTGWRLMADLAGDVVFDVSLDAWASYPPTTNIVTPALSGVDNDEATGLSIAVAAGDVFGFEITGVPLTIQRVTLELTLVVTG